eukprot:scaffold1272_cov250-Pinguiococcus_pyrenoidosus.AAC.71
MPMQSRSNRLRWRPNLEPRSSASTTASGFLRNTRRRRFELGWNSSMKLKEGMGVSGDSGAAMSLSSVTELWAGVAPKSRSAEQRGVQRP